MTPELAQHLQSLEKDDFITLHKIDLNPIGVVEEYYFTPTNNNGTIISFDGQPYAYASISISSVEWKGDGTSTSASLVIPNIDKFGASLVTQYNDLVGVKVTRMRTFRHFLDGEEMADPEAIISKEIWRVERKVRMDKTVVEFELLPMHDVSNEQVPARVCLKRTCDRVYRKWNPQTNSFDSLRTTCPFQGSFYFKKDGTPTDNPAEDACSRDNKGCRLRYGNNPLPIRAMLGMKRV